jgi:AGCS family alanine or glycine:cation symporter
MWLTGVFGIATKYSEALLAVKYRVQTADGQMAGGPMYALERGLNMKWLAVVFAALTAIAAFGIGNTVQANSIASMLKETYDVSPYISGIVMTVLTAMVILGGIKSIARVCEALVPFMAIFYVIGCAIILLSGFSTILDSIALICSSAFSGPAAVGGFLGAGMKEAMRFGIARGLFSNESGLGSAPIVAAAAQTKNPVRQALVSSSGTFWDTVSSAPDGLVLVNTGVWQQGLKAPPSPRKPFRPIPVIGPFVLAIGLLTSYSPPSSAGPITAKRLPSKCSAKRSSNRTLPVGPASSSARWPACRRCGTSPTPANGLMAVPNLVSLLLLSGVLVSGPANTSGTATSTTSGRFRRRPWREGKRQRLITQDKKPAPAWPAAGSFLSRRRRIRLAGGAIRGLSGCRRFRACRRTPSRRRCNPAGPRDQQEAPVDGVQAVEGHLRQAPVSSSCGWPPSKSGRCRSSLHRQLDSIRGWPSRSPIRRSASPGG